MEQGFVKLHRKIQDCDFYFAEPFTRMQAWIDLLVLASYAEHDTIIRGNVVEVEVGKVVASMDFMASRWKWSKGKVLRFISYLQNKGMIELQKSHIINTISICNYSKYQFCDTTDKTTDDITDEQTDVLQTDYRQDTHKKGKKGKKGNNNNPPIIPPLKDEWDDVLSDWFEYKRQRRETYKSQMSIDRLKTHLKKLSNGDIETAKAIINQSIANNWQGLFALKETAAPNAHTIDYSKFLG